MRSTDFAPCWPQLLAQLVVNFALGAGCVFLMRFGVDDEMAAVGAWTAQAIVLALLAVLIAHTRSVQLALAVLFPTLHAYVVFGGATLLPSVSQPQPALILYGILSVATAAAITALDWLFGVRITRDRVERESQPVRFRLTDLIGWTAAVSLPLMLFRLFDFDRLAETLTDLIAMVAVLAIVIGGPMLWMGLDPRPPTIGRRLVLLAAFVAAVFLLIHLGLNHRWYWGGWTLQRDLQLFVPLVIVFGLVLGGNLLVLRRLGFRRRRR